MLGKSTKVLLATLLVISVVGTGLTAADSGGGAAALADEYTGVDTYAAAGCAVGGTAGLVGGAVGGTFLGPGPGTVGGAIGGAGAGCSIGA